MLEMSAVSTWWVDWKEATGMACHHVLWMIGNRVMKKERVKFSNLLKWKRKSRRLGWDADLHLWMKKSLLSLLWNEKKKIKNTIILSLPLSANNIFPFSYRSVVTVADSGNSHFIIGLICWNSQEGFRHLFKKTLFSKIHWRSMYRIQLDTVLTLTLPFRL